MDFNLITMFLQLIIGLIVVLGLMMITLRVSNKGITNFTTKKYIRVIDKVQLSKDSYIVVAKIGDKGIIFVTSGNNTEKLQELSFEEIEKIEKEKRESLDNMTHAFDKYIEKVKTIDKAKIIENIKTIDKAKVKSKISTLVKKKSKEEKYEK